MISLYKHILFIKIVIFFASIANATTYYISTSGKDTNPGTASAPFRTITYTVGKMVAGDTTYVKGGLYKEGFIVFKRSGTKSAPIKLIAAANERPIIESNQIGEKSIQIVNAAGVNKAIGWITIEGFEIRNFRVAILLRSAHDITIRRNWIHNISAPPGQVTGDVHAQGISGNGVRILIDRNRINRVGSFEACAARPIHCNQDHGLYIAGSNFTITNNLFYGNLAFGIQAAASYTYNSLQQAGPEYAGVKNWLIANNTFAYQFYRGGITLWGPAENVQIENNIFYENNSKGAPSETQGINLSSRSNNITIRNNLAYASGSGGTLFISRDSAIRGVDYMESGNIVNSLNPNFVNAPTTMPSSPNFALTSRSPAINHGLTNSIVRFDFLGTSRPQGGAYDIGAYEYHSAGTASAVPLAPIKLRIN